MKPDAVRRADEAADRAHQEAYPNGQDPVANPDAAEIQSQAGDDPPEGPAPELNGAASPSEQGGEDWRQRYLSLKGKYDNEVPRMQQDLQGMRIQLGAAVQQVEQLRTMPRPVGESQPQAQGPQQLVSPDEITEYGEPFVDFMRRLAIDTIRPELQKVGDRVQQVVQTSATTANQAMLEELARRVPDFRRWDTDAGFNAWLNETDFMAGVARRDMLRNAEQRHDGARVAAFFQAYLRETGQTAQSAQQPTAGQTQPATLALETMVGPGRTTSPSPSTQGRPTYTERDIARFYGDVARGVFRNRPEEQARIEGEILQAGAEGRVHVAPKY